MGSAAEHTPSLGSWGLDLAYNSKLRSASHLSEINPLFSVMKLHFNHPKKLRESIADQCFDIFQVKRTDASSLAINLLLLGCRANLQFQVRAYLVLKQRMQLWIILHISIEGTTARSERRWVEFPHPHNQQLGKSQSSRPQIFR